MHISDETAKDIWIILGTLMAVVVAYITYEYYWLWKDSKQNRSTKNNK